MKKMALTMALAVALIGASAGAVVAATTANPSSDVLYNPNQAHPYTPPSEYAEGITIQEAVTSWAPGCNAEGILTTTRLGDDVVQELVVTTGYESGVDAGDHCSRAGTVSSTTWSGWRRNTN